MCAGKTMCIWAALGNGPPNISDFVHKMTSSMQQSGVQVSANVPNWQANGTDSSSPTTQQLLQCDALMVSFPLPGASSRGRRHAVRAGIIRISLTSDKAGRTCLCIHTRNPESIHNVKLIVTTGIH